MRLDPQLPASEALTRSRVDEDIESQLAGQGVVSHGGAPCMFIRHKLAPAALPDGIHLAAVDSAEVLRDSVRVNMDAYPRLGLPSEVVASLFEHGVRVLEDNVCDYVAYLDNEPLATALTYVSGPSAGIYWVGTVAAAERQGLGEACTRMAVNAGLDRGARLVTLRAAGIPADRVRTLR